MAGLIIPYVSILGFVCLKKGYKPAAFYLLAFLIMGLGVVIYILKDHGILPYNSFTDNAMIIGNPMEALILAFALADKMNNYRKDIIQHREMLLHQSRQFSKNLILFQEKERKRIAGELHDSICQYLGIIKNKFLISNDSR